VAESIRPYRKLGQPVYGLFRSTRLLVGSDHLLLLNSNFGFESYKRFYLHELEAITLRRTPRRFAWNIVHGALLTFFVYLAFAFGGFEDWSASGASWPASASGKARLLFFLLPAIFFLLCLVVNTLLGPTCSMHLQSGAGVEQLKMVKRLRRARKLRRYIQPLVERAQAASASPAMGPGPNDPVGFTDTPLESTPAPAAPAEEAVAPAREGEAP
jgi:hypothetical protein